MDSIVCSKSTVESLTTMAIPRVRSSRALKVAILGSGNWGCALETLRKLNSIQVFLRK